MEVLDSSLALSLSNHLLYSNLPNTPTSREHVTAWTSASFRLSRTLFKYLWKPHGLGHLCQPSAAPRYSPPSPFCSFERSLGRGLSFAIRLRSFHCPESSQSLNFFGQHINIELFHDPQYDSETFHKSVHSHSQHAVGCGLVLCAQNCQFLISYKLCSHGQGCIAV